MSIKMKKEELELISNKDIAAMILEDSKRTLNTADIFKKIIKLLELPESTFEAKIADFYTALSTDKRFILLPNGKWDLRSNHTSDKVIKITTEDEIMLHMSGIPQVYADGTQGRIYAKIAPSTTADYGEIYLATNVPQSAITNLSITMKKII